MKKSQKYFLLIALILISYYVWLSEVYSYINLDTLKEHQNFLQDYVEKNFITASILYLLSYFIIVSLSIPTATVMTLVGGFLFGQTVATICVVLSASFGACIVFLSAKFASKNSVKKGYGSWVQKMKDGFEENAFLYMLTLRLMPIFPFVIINIVSGVLQIRLKTFFFGTLIGIIPATYIYVSVGVAMRALLNRDNFTPETLLKPEIFIALFGLGMLTILPVIYRKLRVAFE